MAVTDGAAGAAGLRCAGCRPSARPLVTPGAVGTASSTSDSARSTGPTRPSTPRQAIAAAGGDWGIVGGRAALARRWSTRWRAGPPVQRHQLSDGRPSTRVVGALAGVRHAAERPGRGRRAAGRPGDPGGHADRHREGVPARPGDRAAATTTTCAPTWRPTGRRDRARPAARGRAAARPAGAGRWRWSAATTCRPTAHRLRAPVLRAGARHGDPGPTGSSLSRPPWSTGSCRPPRRRPWPGRGGRSASPTWPRSTPSRTGSGCIEDDFPGGRPAWDAAGAVLTDDAGRLGAAEAARAQRRPLGPGVPGRAGRRRDHRRGAGLPGMPELLRQLVAEDVAPSFAPPPASRSSSTATRCSTRFANPAIGHRTIQVAMDGSQKLPQRLLAHHRRPAGAGPAARLAALAWRPGCGSSGARRRRAGAAAGRPAGRRIRAALRGPGPTPTARVAALLGSSRRLPGQLRRRRRADRPRRRLADRARTRRRGGDAGAGVGVTRRHECRRQTPGRPPGSR